MKRQVATAIVLIVTGVIIGLLLPKPAKQPTTTPKQAPVSHEPAPRFVLEEHTVPAMLTNGPDTVFGARPTLFKLDSSIGTIWKLEDDRYQLIPRASRFIPHQPPVPSEQIVAREQALKRMQALIIPEIDFRAALVPDILEFLQRQTEDLDPKGHGITIIFKPPAPTSEHDDDDPFGDDDGFVGSDQLPPITMSARHLSLMAALDIITDLTGLSWNVRGDVVYVTARQAPPFSTGIYNLPPIAALSVEQIRQTLEGNDNVSSPQPQYVWEDAFSGLGITWPRGSSIQYDPSTFRFTIANTDDELKRIEQILNKLDSQDNAPGRYVLSSAEVDGKPSLFLQDTSTRHSWRYTLSGGRHGNKEIFQHQPTDHPPAHDPRL